MFVVKISSPEKPNEIKTSDLYIPLQKLKSSLTHTQKSPISSKQPLTTTKNTQPHPKLVLKPSKSAINSPKCLQNPVSHHVDHNYPNLTHFQNLLKNDQDNTNTNDKQPQPLMSINESLVANNG